ncbi:SRPBCC family protein [Sphingomonas oligophenolica]|uniref:SRPBCC family protein n=1 Tax=Sphingomonas oligophenolica TaxID=301154 RepID=A0ABU9XY74_9SPHN
MSDIATADADARAALHSTFQVERDYPQSPSRVFRAFADKEMVRRWRVEDEGCEIHEFTFDFRIGGRELSRFSFAGGPEIRLDAEFQDIVPDQRIVFAYRMGVGSNPFSASLTTIELTPSGTGTHLTYTEQVAMLDGSDSARGREEGCRQLLEKLAAELDGPG